MRDDDSRARRPLELGALRPHLRLVGAVALIAGGAGSVAYDGTVRLLRRSHRAVPMADATLKGAHDVALLVLPWAAILAGALLLRRLRNDAGAGPRHVVLGAVLLGAGWAWAGWGLFDQHALHLYEIEPLSAHPLVWDLAFHGVGVLVGAIGWNVLDAVRRPGGSVSRR